MSVSRTPDRSPAPTTVPPRLSRRYLGLLAAGATAAVLGVIGTASRRRSGRPYAPAASDVPARPTPMAPTPTDQAEELVIGPASVIDGMTVLRVSATSSGVDLLTSTGAFRANSTGYTPAGIRLLSVDRGIGLRPLDVQPQVIATGSNPGQDTVFVVFDGIEGDGEVEVKFPGLGLIDSVPVVASSQAPFRIV